MGQQPGVRLPVDYQRPAGLKEGDEVGAAHIAPLDATLAANAESKGIRAIAFTGHGAESFTCSPPRRHRGRAAE